MSIEDFLQVAGGTLSELGTPNRRFQSPVATGLSTALVAAGRASGFQKGKREVDRFRASREAIESKIGVPYDFFLKLSPEAQNDILKNAGMIGGPPEAPLEMFGGRTLSQVQNEGAPGGVREKTVPGGTGVFLGLPDATVQNQHPALPPLKTLSKTGADKAINAYLGQETPPSSLDTYREGMLSLAGKKADRDQKRLESDLRTAEVRRKAIQDQRELIQARKADIGKKDSPVEPWVIETARANGVPIPDGITSVTRKDFDAIAKFNKPVGYIVNTTRDIAYAVAKIEAEAGTEFTDQELQEIVRQKATEASAVAGPTALSMIVQNVKAELQNLRGMGPLLKSEGMSNPESPDWVPDPLAEDEEDYQDESDPEDEPEYGR